MSADPGEDSEPAAPVTSTEEVTQEAGHEDDAVTTAETADPPTGVVAGHEDDAVATDETINPATSVEAGNEDDATTAIETTDPPTVTEEAGNSEQSKPPVDDHPSEDNAQDAPVPQAREYDAESLYDAGSSYVLEVAECAKWAEGVLGATPDSLWYERLGETYGLYSGLDESVEAYQQAITMDETNWRAVQGLALTFARKPDIASAATQMQKALAMQRGLKDESIEGRQALLDNILWLADWQIDLKEFEGAFSLYAEALEMVPDDHNVHFRRLKHVLATGDDHRVGELIKEMIETKGTDGESTMFRSILPSAASDEINDVVMGQIFTAVQNDPVLFRDVLVELSGAIKTARTTEQPVDLAYLLLHKGNAVYHYDVLQVATSDSPVVSWSEAVSLRNSTSPPNLYEPSRQALRIIAKYHFDKARQEPNPQSHLEKLDHIVGRQEGDFSQHDGRSYLATFNAMAGQSVKARELLMVDMRQAHDLLTDDTDSNDWSGYYGLADALCHFGDQQGSLTAWSLIGKTKVGIEQGSYSCDGKCGTTWPYAGDFYNCMCCTDVQFCTGCLELLKDNKLKRFICSQQHQWLYVPLLSDAEYQEVDEQKIVTVGGQMIDGRRQGGEKVSHETFFTKIYEEWGLPYTRTAQESSEATEEASTTVLSIATPAVTSEIQNEGQPGVDSIQLSNGVTDQPLQLVEVH